MGAGDRIGKAFRASRAYIEHAKQHATIVSGGPVRRLHRLLHPADRRRRRPNLASTSCSARRSSGRVVDGARPMTTTSGWETLAVVEQHVALRADRRGVFAQDRRAVAAGRCRRCARGGELLRERQADRRSGRPAAVRRAPRLGHNDKAGSKLNLVVGWSARSMKENFNPPKDYRYPS